MHYDSAIWRAFELAAGFALGIWHERSMSKLRDRGE